MSFPTIIAQSVHRHVGFTPYLSGQIEPFQIDHWRVTSIDIPFPSHKPPESEPTLFNCSSEQRCGMALSQDTSPTVLVSHLNLVIPGASNFSIVISVKIQDIPLV